MKTGNTKKLPHLQLQTSNQQTAHGLEMMMKIKDKNLNKKNKSTRRTGEVINDIINKIKSLFSQGNYLCYKNKRFKYQKRY